MNRNEFSRCYHRHNDRRILLEILWYSRKTYEIVSQPLDFTREDRLVKDALKKVGEAKKRIPQSEKKKKGK